MKYYLSADGGGTKLTAILFNDQFQLLSYGSGQAINYTSQENIIRSIADCLDPCLHGYDGIELEKAYYAMPATMDIFVEQLRMRVQVHDIEWLSEGRMALLAGLQRKTGIVALSGTGSGVFGIHEGTEEHIGGWGHLLGDLGSAYEIGREAIMAVLKRYEKRGPATLLRTLFRDEWQISSKMDFITQIYHEPYSRRKIASAARFVAVAAKQGDVVAIRILEEAGEALAEQTNAMVKLQHHSREPIVMLAGSVWKGARFMYEQFTQNVLAQHSGARICMPTFEPVMGGLFAQYFEDEQKGLDQEMVIARLQQHDAIVYRTDW